MTQVNNLAVLLNDLGRATGNSKMLREAEPLKREVTPNSQLATRNLQLATCTAERVTRCRRRSADIFPRTSW